MRMKREEGEEGSKGWEWREGEGWEWREGEGGEGWEWREEKEEKEENEERRRRRRIFVSELKSLKTMKSRILHCYREWNSKISIKVYGWCLNSHIFQPSWKPYYSRFVSVTKFILLENYISSRWIFQKLKMRKSNLIKREFKQFWLEI